MWSVSYPAGEGSSGCSWMGRKGTGWELVNWSRGPLLSPLLSSLLFLPAFSALTSHPREPVRIIRLCLQTGLASTEFDCSCEFPVQAFSNLLRILELNVEESWKIKGKILCFKRSLWTKLIQVIYCCCCCHVVSPGFRPDPGFRQTFHFRLICQVKNCAVSRKCTLPLINIKEIYETEHATILFFCFFPFSTKSAFFSVQSCSTNNERKRPGTTHSVTLRGSPREI